MRTKESKILKEQLIDTLEALFKIYSPSYDESDISNFLCEQLQESGWDVEVDSLGNVMASRGDDSGQFVPLLNAHMDTCQDESDWLALEDLNYDEEKDRFQLEGVQLGCDDKAGLGIILTLAKYTDLQFKILFTVQEEVGQRGMREIPSECFENVCWAFSLDRKGANDVITEYLGKSLCTDEFYNEIVNLGYEVGLKFQRALGSKADTYYFAGYCPAVNLSVGYYGAHRKNDYLNVSETYQMLNFVEKCITEKERLVDT